MNIRHKTLFILFFSLSFIVQAQESFPSINTENISIVRDSWGVPHIYGKTDEEAVYGLAWATAEDDFENMQQTLLAIRGKYGSVKGKEGAILDFLFHIVNADDIVERDYNKTFSPKFKKIINAYVQAANKFAETHPKEVLHKSIFPINEKDVIKGYVVILSLMANVGYDIERIFNNKMLTKGDSPMVKGSNAIAMNSSITTDGKAYLAVNSHQPVEGPFSWYEAHINSEEGWNFLGSLLPGGLTPQHGTNEHLGWAHTLNYPDLNDVYQLEMHPNKKLHYKFDGEWLKLEERPITSWVKVGFLKIPIRKKFYWSKYGTTIKNKNGFFSIRFAGNMVLKAPEQWYHMNKAKNFDDFKSALAMQGIPSINTVYADREDNIYFLSNGLFPDRDPQYKWKDVLTGNTSENLWEPKFKQLEELVQVLNPSCGYLFNTNNSPYYSTCAAENPKPSDYDPTLGHLEKNTGRAMRIMELMEKYEKVSFEDFKKIKYDLKSCSPFYTRSIENLEEMLHLDPQKYPDIADIIEALKKWDRRVDVHNKQAAIISLSVQYLLKYMRKRNIVDYNNSLPVEEFANALRFAKKHLKKHFGRIDIELGQLQVHMRGKGKTESKKKLPIWGIPEVIPQMYTVKYKKGKYRSYVGESYIQLVQYSKDGVELETINCFGASNKKDSPHYEDQMDLFVQQKTKKMTLNKKEVFKNAKRIYHPE